MISFDEFTFNLPRLWIAVGLLVLIDLICLGSSLFGNPAAFWFLQWLPRPLATGMLLVGPFAVAGIWLVVMVLGIVFHRWRALWLLLPALFFLPATFLQLLVWGCAVKGECI